MMSDEAKCIDCGEWVKNDADFHDCRQSSPVVAANSPSDPGNGTKQSESITGQQSSEGLTEEEQAKLQDLRMARATCMNLTSEEQRWCLDTIQRLQWPKRYTKEEITAGLSLAQQWYEGWKIEDIQPEQLIEAIEKAILRKSEAAAGEQKG